MEGISEIDAVKAEIAALRSRYQEELKPLTDRLSALQEETLRREGLLDLDAEDAAMREHLELMM